MTAPAVPVVHWDHPHGGLICGEPIRSNWHTKTPRRVTCAVCRLEVESRLLTYWRTGARVIHIVGQAPPEIVQVDGP